MAWAFFLK